MERRHSYGVGIDAPHAGRIGGLVPGLDDVCGAVGSERGHHGRAQPGGDDFGSVSAREQYVRRMVTARAAPEHALPVPLDQRLEGLRRPGEIAREIDGC